MNPNAQPNSQFGIPGQPANGPAMQQPTVIGPQQSGPAPVKAANPNSTQNTLQIAEIRDGIVIMNDGSFRSVVMVKSINSSVL